MKKFLVKLCIMSSLLGIILFSLIAFQAYRITHYSWELPKEKHILFMGASQLSRSIDDSSMKSVFNFARPSERYMYTYIKLQHLCEANPQIDTIFLQCAHTDLAVDCDYKYFDEIELAGYIDLYWPLFSDEDLNFLALKKKQLLQYMIKGIANGSIYFRNSWFDALGKYEPIPGEMDRTKVKPHRTSDRRTGHAINYFYLRKIIEYCNTHEIKLYLMQCPVYHPDYFFDDVYHKKAIKQFAEKAEYIDFSSWPAEDDEMYDPHHLSEKGAIRFTNELKRLYHLK